MNSRLFISLTNFSASPKILTAVLPLVMVYLVVGTIAQKYVGLYEATRMFFSAWIIWWQAIPLPGFPVLIAIIFINLTCKLLFNSPWSKSRLGNNITHIGVLLLLLGGLFTAVTAQEGYIDIAEGESKSFVSDYHKRVFVILDENADPLVKIPHKNLKPGDVIRIPGGNTAIKILHSCENCKVEARAQQENQTYHGMAEHMQLVDAPLRKVNEENLPGITFEMQGSEYDATYLVIEHVPRFPEIRTAEGSRYFVTLRRERRPLPFNVTLLDFKKGIHPGTTLAKSYESRVLIEDEGAQWEAVIRMNEPLRYKGYTLYQSSYLDHEGQEVSVLSVVWNVGRIFPYLSGIVICIGIMLHIFLKYSRLTITAGKNRKALSDA